MLWECSHRIEEITCSHSGQYPVLENGHLLPPAIGVICRTQSIDPGIDRFRLEDAGDEECEIPRFVDLMTLPRIVYGNVGWRIFRIRVVALQII